MSAIAARAEGVQGGLDDRSGAVTTTTRPSKRSIGDKLSTAIEFRLVKLRFNHMELTVPMGALTLEFCADVAAFYGDVFGFSSTIGRLFDQQTQTLKLPDDSFLLLIEGDTPISAPGFDHLGFELSSRDAVDETLAKVRAWQARDDRVQLKEYPDGTLDGRFYHAYYVRHLLPLWFDVQYSEPV